VVNDLHGSIVSKCGAEYSKTGHCTLQVPNGETADYDALLNTELCPHLGPGSRDDT